MSKCFDYSRVVSIQSNISNKHYVSTTTHSRLPAVVAASIASGSNPSENIRGRITLISSIPVRTKQLQLGDYKTYAWECQQGRPRFVHLAIFIDSLYC